MEDRQVILELARQIRGLADNGGRITYKLSMAGETIAAVCEKGLFDDVKFFQLKALANPERHSRTDGSPKSREGKFVSVFISVIDWLDENREVFEFDFPTFAPWENASGLMNRNYWKTNLPAVAEVIELQCKYSFKREPTNGNPKKNRKKLPWDEDAKLAAEAFINQLKCGDPQRLEDFCTDFCIESDVSVTPSVLKKKLSDNRDIWDPKNEYHLRGGRRIKSHK